MGDPYLAETRVVSFSFAPRGWAQCNGALIPINQNQALFALLGTTYGGDGRTNFALPDLRGRTPIHFGNGFALGQRGGEETHTLTIGELPQHTHATVGNSGAADQVSPVNNLWATTGSFTAFAAHPNETLDPQSVTRSGGSQAHENHSPFLVLNIVMALQGIFPSGN